MERWIQTQTLRTTLRHTNAEECPVERVSHVWQWRRHLRLNSRFSLDLLIQNTTLPVARRHSSLASLLVFRQSFSHRRLFNCSSIYSLNWTLIRSRWLLDFWDRIHPCILCASTSAALCINRHSIVSRLPQLKLTVVAQTFESSDVPTFLSFNVLFIGWFATSIHQVVQQKNFKDTFIDVKFYYIYSIATILSPTCVEQMRMVLSLQQKANFAPPGEKVTSRPIHTVSGVHTPTPSAISQWADPATFCRVTHSCASSTLNGNKWINFSVHTANTKFHVSHWPDIHELYSEDLWARQDWYIQQLYYPHVHTPGFEVRMNRLPSHGRCSGDWVISQLLTCSLK